MNDVFVSSIEIKKIRNLENFTINLSDTERKHLIITGKNGSGKTSLLLELDKFISEIIHNKSFNNYDDLKKDLRMLNNEASLEKEHKDMLASLNNYEKDKYKEDLKKDISRYGNTIIIFSDYSYSDVFNFLSDFNYITIFFEARRLAKLKVSKGINKIELKNKNKTNERINKDFIQYIVNLKAERSFARDDNDLEAVQRIDLWFKNFETQLKELFDSPRLKLIFDRKNYNFFIKIAKQEPFSFNQLSDGYAAVIAIITELILRMEAIKSHAYDLQGIVLIDEIETHLHVALQKKIMPFLCAFFPNIQFIVTTHSPFVLSSISNAVICDLETKEVINDLSDYSYDALVESYFDTDKYSTEIKEKIHRFEQLSEKETLDEAEENEYDDLDDYFSDLPKFRAEGLAIKLQQIELKKLAQKG